MHKYKNLLQTWENASKMLMSKCMEKVLFFLRKVYTCSTSVSLMVENVDIEDNGEHWIYSHSTGCLVLNNARPLFVLPLFGYNLERRLFWKIISYTSIYIQTNGMLPMEMAQFSVHHCFEYISCTDRLESTIKLVYILFR